MTARPAAQRRAASGTIVGFVMRLARESVPLTQSGMAEVLGVDLGTVQGRESGRRPVGAMKSADLLALSRRLLALGADPMVLGLLEPAMDADRLISTALEPPSEVEQHPLAGWVHTRATAHMINWAVNGTTPPALTRRPSPARHGPVATAPLLPSEARTAFFAHLRRTVEAAERARDGLILLRRQALYLTSYDRAEEADVWMAHALHRRRDALTTRGWSAHWAEARSTAAALARRGDPVPLLDFIARGIADDDAAEAANLNYWAYWLGATHQPQADDTFTRDQCRAEWDPVTLLRRLSAGLHQAPGYVDLYAHTLWALLEAHQWLPRAASDLARTLGERTAVLLDEGRISPRARQELSTVHYVLRDHR